MNEQEIWDLLMKDPRAAFKAFEEKGVDFNKVSSELDIARKIVKDKLRKSEEIIRATEFVFWISYYAEIEIRNAIKEIESKLSGGFTPMMEGMLDKLHFGDKISLIKKYYSTKSTDSFVSLLWEINNLRNNVAHGRLEELSYGGLTLSDAKGQILLLIDFIKSASKKS
jgi:hypothetical protein